MEATTRPAGDRPLPDDALAHAPRRRLVVGIPSAGRPQILTDTVRNMSSQKRLPDLVVLSIAGEDDIDRAELTGLPFPVKVVVGPRGRAAQRNRVLERLQPADILLIVDDDFLMRADYIEKALDLFLQYPDMVLATGRPVADGHGDDHLSAQDQLVESSPSAQPEELHEIPNGFGCNIAIRARPIVKFGLRFDEALPPHSWLEDVDFSRQLADYGRLVRSDHLCGVDLGAPADTVSGRRLGYSQIASPIYMLRKGTVSLGRTLHLTSRVLASNLLRSLYPKGWSDSRGRLRGNLRALSDILRGRIDPPRAGGI